MTVISDVLIFSFAIVCAFLIRKYLFKDFWGLPISIIAGMLALLGSGDIAGFYQLSGHLNFYIEFLLCILFATIPLSVGHINKAIVTKNKQLIKYNLFQHLFQWGSGLLITTLILPLFIDVPQFLGIILPAGFAGGHGSGAVIGSIYAKLGYDYVLSLAMMMATIGAFASVFGGLIWILRAKQFNVGKIEPIKFHFPKLKVISYFSTIAVLSYAFKIGLNKVLFFDLPMLVIGFILGVFTKYVLKIDFKEIDNFSELITGLLVCVGIASIKILVVKQFLAPVIVLSLFGIVYGVLLFKFVGTKTLGELAFEKSLFTWGWSIGGIVFGVSLVSMIRNKMNSKDINKFPLLYVIISPIEIFLLLVVSRLLIHSYTVYIGLTLFILSLFVLRSLFKANDKSLK